MLAWLSLRASLSSSGSAWNSREAAKAASIVARHVEEAHALAGLAHLGGHALEAAGAGEGGRHVDHRDGPGDRLGVLHRLRLEDVHASKSTGGLRPAAALRGQAASSSA